MSSNESAKNRRGLLARCLVLQIESPAGLQSLLNDHQARLRPQDAVELGLVEDLVAAHWRLRRAWAIETRLMDEALDSQDSPVELGRLAAAFSSLAATPALSLLHRYQTRLHLMYQRSLHNLLLLRSCAPPATPSEPRPSGSGLPSTATPTPPPATPPAASSASTPASPTPSTATPSEPRPSGSGLPSPRRHGTRSRHRRPELPGYAASSGNRLRSAATNARTFSTTIAASLAGGCSTSPG